MRRFTNTFNWSIYLYRKVYAFDKHWKQVRHAFVALVMTGYITAIKANTVPIQKKCLVLTFYVLNRLQFLWRLTVMEHGTKPVLYDWYHRHLLKTSTGTRLTQSTLYMRRTNKDGFQHICPQTAMEAIASITTLAALCFYFLRTSEFYAARHRLLFHGHGVLSS